ESNRNRVSIMFAVLYGVSVQVGNGTKDYLLRQERALRACQRSYAPADRLDGVWTKEVICRSQTNQHTGSEYGYPDFRGRDQQIRAFSIQHRQEGNRIFQAADQSCNTLVRRSAARSAHYLGGGET